VPSSESRFDGSSRSTVGFVVGEVKEDDGMRESKERASMWFGEMMEIRDVIEQICDRFSGIQVD
jgi:hypothetical protein